MPLPSARLRAVVGACILLAVLVLGALGAGSTLPPVAIELPSDPPPATLPPQPSESSPADGPITLPPESDEPPLELPSWLGEALRGVLLIAAAALAAWALWWIVRRQIAMRRLRARGAEVRFSEEDAILDEESMAESFSEALERLRLGASVDEVIVDCWRHLERLVSEAGLTRAATQTSDEFTVDVLQATSADEAALRRLAGLYRRAAYSAHRLTGADRDSAVAALGTLAESLGGAPVPSDDPGSREGAR